MLGAALCAKGPAEVPLPKRTGLHVAMVAGEVSGDLLAGLLMDGLRKRWPDLVCTGMGGPRMVERGFEAWWPSQTIAVRGYVEVLGRYREIVSIRHQLKARLLGADRPEVFVGVDAPDFNLDLAAALKAGGVPTVQFVCPSIWAWRPKRIERIRRSVDHVLCIFPFEPELLRQHGIAATYVGHPLAQEIPVVPNRASARAKLGLPDAAKVVAVLPGSRSDEVKYLGKVLLEAAACMRAQYPQMQFVVPAAPSLRPAIEAALAGVPGLADSLRVLDGQAHTVLEACDVALVASGTASLEAALFKRPMVIAYKMHALTWLMMARKRLQPWVGLPNILCQDFVVPEYLQNAASPQALARATLAWFHHPQKVSALEARFTALHHDLRAQTTELATHAIEKLLQR